MSDLDKLWDALSKVPALLSQYESFSRPLLTVLLLGGLLGLAALAVIRWYARRKVSWALVGLFGAFVFFSTAGLYLKHMGERQFAAQREDWVRENSFPTGEPGLIVFDFTIPSDAAAHDRAQVHEHMQLLVHSMSSVLAEDLPDVFRIPRVVGLPTESSPWQDGISEANAQDAVRRLNALEVLWGTVYHAQSQEHAKVSLGLRESSRAAIETVLPLSDVLLDENPSADRQFGDGRFELLGTVCLGLALLTYERALNAQGDERKQLLASAVDQLAHAREALNSRSQDRILKRTLYSSTVTDVMDSALREAGVSP
jgi:hypothetical protein